VIVANAAPRDLLSHFPSASANTSNSFVAPHSRETIVPNFGCDVRMEGRTGMGAFRFSISITFADQAHQFSMFHKRSATNARQFQFAVLSELVKLRLGDATNFGRHPHIIGDCDNVRTVRPNLVGWDRWHMYLSQAAC